MVRRSPGTPVARAQAYIEELGLFLTSAGAWSSTEQDWATETGSGYQPKSVNAVMPAYSIQVPHGVYTVTLYAYHTDLSGVINVDDYVWWAHTNKAAIIEHNIKPAVTGIELRRSTNNFGGNDTLEAGAFSTLYWPTSYFLTGVMRSERWWKYLATGGPNNKPPWYGQLVLGQQFTLSRNPNCGVDVDLIQQQVRQPTTAGVDRIFEKERIPRREFRFPFSYHSGAQWQEARDRIFHQGRFGSWRAS